MNINIPKKRRPSRQEVRFEFDCYDFMLLRPRCGDGYLHHCRVSVFSRRQEDGPVTEIRVFDSGLADILTRDGSRNPSSRRDGLAIGFWCECCGADDIELTIAQHKGNTHVGWRQAAPGSACAGYMPEMDDDADDDVDNPATAA